MCARLTFPWLSDSLVGVESLGEPGPREGHFINASVQLVVEVRVLCLDTVVHHCLQYSFRLLQ